MANTITVTVKQQSATTSEGTAREHTVVIDRPQDRGMNKGAQGGELFLIGLGGCFMSNLLAEIRSDEKAQVSNVSIDVIATKEGIPERFTSIALDISADYNAPELIQKLVNDAKAKCLVSNSIKDAIKLSFNIKDRNDFPKQ